MKTAIFVKERYGAEVATILEDQNQILEVIKLKDGRFRLTLHNRREDRDQWDDLSADLTREHFEALGTIAGRPGGDEILKALDASYNALKSYEYGNGAPGLARDIAEFIKPLIDKLRGRA